MEYKQQQPYSSKNKPRLVIHGGAGNIVRHGFPASKYKQYRSALLSIVR